MLSLAGRVLQSVVRLCCAHPGLTVVVGGVFAVLGLAYAAHSLTLETSKFNLLPSHQRYATLYKEYSEDFGQLEDIVVKVQWARRVASVRIPAGMITRIGPVTTRIGGCDQRNRDPGA